LGWWCDEIRLRTISGLVVFRAAAVFFLLRQFSILSRFVGMWWWCWIWCWIQLGGDRCDFVVVLKVFCSPDLVDNGGFCGGFGGCGEVCSSGVGMYRSYHIYLWSWFITLT
jgi:hypothetical protein